MSAYRILEDLRIESKKTTCGYEVTLSLRSGAAVTGKPLPSSDSYYLRLSRELTPGVPDGIVLIPYDVIDMVAPTWL